jgi:hypothetical protein
MVGVVLESGEGESPGMLGVMGAVEGIVPVAAPPRSNDGALGSPTGSRRPLSLMCRRWLPEHPVTSVRTVLNTARRAVVFIELLLRECVMGARPLGRDAAGRDATTTAYRGGRI